MRHIGSFAVPTPQPSDPPGTWYVESALKDSNLIGCRHSASQCCPSALASGPGRAPITMLNAPGLRAPRSFDLDEWISSQVVSRRHHRGVTTSRERVTTPRGGQCRADV